MFGLLFIVCLCVTGASATALLGAIVFQGAADTQDLLATVNSARNAGAQHIFVCQPSRSTREAEGAMSEWSRYTHVPSLVHQATRNGCLRVYGTLVPATIVSFLLVERNMRIRVNGSIPVTHWQDAPGHGNYLEDNYAVVPDQSGLVLDWTPFIMRMGARCAYLGRFVCLYDDVTHRHLLQLDYELDVEEATRELIERDIVSPQRYPPPVLFNVFVTRHLPPPDKVKEQPEPEPPSDPHFAYAWYWMGRELEAQMNTEAARKAYVRRLENSGDPGELWYSIYRLGDTAPDPGQSIPLLLEAYNLQSQRREPLAALMRRYADEGKYAVCLLFGAAALTIPFPRGPDTGPHIEVPLYEWMVADELSICLARSGRVKEAAALAEKLLSIAELTTLDDKHRGRIMENLLVWKTKAGPVPAAENHQENVSSAT